MPDMVYERSISVIAGRPNGGKTLLAQQLAIELARGEGDLVGEEVPSATWDFSGSVPKLLGLPEGQ